MSDKFVASNGIKVWRGMFRDFASDTSSLALEMPGARSKAITEFVLHERDEELGRWRWPQEPHLVVYPQDASPGDKRMVLVVSERSGGTVYVKEGEPEDMTVHVVAARYFAAHPEPKPWHDAKPGEVWLIGVPTGPTFEFSAMTAVEHDGKIAFSNPGSDEWLAPTYEPLSARRIWPEVSDVAE